MVATNENTFHIKACLGSSMSASKIIAAVFGTLHGTLVAIICLGAVYIGGNGPSLLSMLVILAICILSGGVLCVLLVPTNISWGSNTLTIKRAYGIETTYACNELIRLSAYGVNFGLCFLQFSGRRVIYIGSYGFKLSEWRKFQTWLRHNRGNMVSSVPRL